MNRPVILLLVLLALFAAGCSTGPRTRAFDGTPEGLAAAGARVMSLPDGMSASFTAYLTAEPAAPPRVRFIPFAQARSALSDPAQLCLWSGVPERCDPDAVLASVFAYDSPSGTGDPIESFEPTMDGLRAALGDPAADEPGQEPRTGFIALRSAREPRMDGVESHAWAFDYAAPVILTSDFLCEDEGGLRCHHREDIRRIAWGYGRIGWTVVEPGEDLAASLEAIRLPRSGQTYIEIKQPAPRETYAGITSIDRYDETEFCGEMAISFPAETHLQCLPFARITGFAVRDRMRGPGDVAVDGVLLPFRFLGAAVAATVMGGAGG